MQTVQDILFILYNFKIKIKKIDDFPSMWIPIDQIESIIGPKHLIHQLGSDLDDTNWGKAAQ